MARSYAVVALVALLVLSSCGSDDPPEDQDKRAAAQAGDVTRYCSLTRQLDAEGSKFFAKLEGQNASQREFQAAERRFIEESAGKLDELKRVAPQKVRPDVEKLFAGMRERAGLEPAIEVSNAESSAAEARVRAWEKRNCDR